MGEMLARKGGKSYEDLSIERIFKPLGMNDTKVKLSPEMRKRFAQGYNADGLPAGPWDSVFFAPAVGWRSTLNDMMKFLAVNLWMRLDAKKGNTNDPRIETLYRSVRKTHDVKFKLNDYLGMGLGWHVFTGNNLVDV